MDTVRLTWAEFRALPEYSASAPTGATLGKRWKHNQNAYRRLHSSRCTATHEEGTLGPHCPCIGVGNMCASCRAETERLKPSWLLGEYAPPWPSDRPTLLRIVWKRIVIRIPAAVERTA